MFAFVFGDHWQEAGEYASILSPWLFFSIIMGAFVFKDIKWGFVMVSITQVIYLSGIIYYFIRISEKADS
ncbi:MAG: hypothetical protein IPG39_04310 [Bacteroidetes bacterium]|nr:hypothetical protein [Bacteroidota bacterium]